MRTLRHLYRRDRRLVKTIRLVIATAVVSSAITFGITTMAYTPNVKTVVVVREVPVEVKTEVVRPVYFGPQVVDFVGLLCEANRVKPPIDSATLSALLLSKSVKHGVPFGITLTIAFSESDFRYDAVSNKGKDAGYGLMQVSKVGLEDYNRLTKSKFTQEDLLDVYTNVEIGLFLFKNNKRYVERSITYDHEFYVAYNVGASNFDKYYDSHYSLAELPTGEAYTALGRYLSKKDKVYDLLKQYDGEFFYGPPSIAKG